MLFVVVHSGYFGDELLPPPCGPLLEHWPVCRVVHAQGEPLQKHHQEQGLQGGGSVVPRIGGPFIWDLPTLLILQGTYL